MTLLKAHQPSVSRNQVDAEDETKLCKSHLPQEEPILDHIAECLRQVEVAQVKEGGWTGGDAWFGSINSCVELMLQKGVFSTFIVKQNLAYFPMQELKAVLLARYGTHLHLWSQSFCYGLCLVKQGDLLLCLLLRNYYSSRAKLRVKV